ELMMRVWPAAVAGVREEVADMKAIAEREGQRITIAPSEYLFYAEKVRSDRYDIDANEEEPNINLASMIDAALCPAGQLYGITFHEITGQVPVCQSDVRVWEVKDGDEHLGVFYGDYFARTGKRSGAWASTYRSHETFTGVERTPISSNNNNFVKGAAGEP